MPIQIIVNPVSKLTIFPVTNCTAANWELFGMRQQTNAAQTLPSFSIVTNFLMETSMTALNVSLVISWLF